MVTAVDPDFDIVEMPFDDYLTKPVSREDLLDTVSEMLVRTTYDDQVREYFAVASKKATLETQKTPPQLEASDEYQTVSRRFEDLRETRLLFTVVRTRADDTARCWSMWSGKCPGRAPNPRSPHVPGTRLGRSREHAGVCPPRDPMSAALCPAKPPGRRRWLPGGSL